MQCFGKFYGFSEIDVLGFFCLFFVFFLFVCLFFRTLHTLAKCSVPEVYLQVIYLFGEKASHTPG